MGGRQWMAIDRVVSLDLGKGAVGLRNVTNTLDILDSHFPRFPVLPGVIILGCMGELAGLLLDEQTGQRWQLVGAERVRYRHFVRPGDQMEVRVDLKNLGADVALFSGDVRVDGKSVTTARSLRLTPVAVPAPATTSTPALRSADGPIPTAAPGAGPVEG